MYHVDPVTIERTWNLGHMVTALRIIEMRGRATDEYNASMTALLTKASRG